MVLANGIVARRWHLSGTTLACTSLGLLSDRTEFLRAVRPEAEVTIDGEVVKIGGMSGQPDQAYLNPDWLTGMKPNPGFRFDSYKRSTVGERMAWETREQHRQRVFARSKTKSPEVSKLKGEAVTFTLKGEGKAAGLRAEVRYELYDGLPVFSKQIALFNESGKPVRIDGFKTEVLAAVESESSVDSQDKWNLPNMTVTTDYTFAGMAMGASNKAVKWVPDPLYTTQVNYELKTPCQLEVAAPVGPGLELNPGESFESFRVFELLHDTTDRERKGLQLRRMYRSLAPWVLENPIMLHLTSSDPLVVRVAIDQAAECGFEMVVISFWSGLDMEDVSEANLAKWKGLVDYAHAKGLELGGYSLLASRSVGPETDVIDPKTGKPGGAVFGASPCLCSQWGIDYFAKLRRFIEATGFDLLEHDGSYPGDVCASTSHPGHKGYEDSQWKQYQTIAEFYRWCRARGVFLNVPDNYHLAGSNKTGMGYRESNWSLPRAQQHMHARQNLFDGTWEKTPSMGWMMVPLVEYQGGGAEATIEPLKEHLADYEMHLANNFGFGAQACYRGPRLYDSPETKSAVIKWVQWFKDHRTILESDVIHVKRANGRDLDAILHVDPFGHRRGMLLVWNPGDQDVTEDLDVPLYFSGLRGKASVTDSRGSTTQVKLNGQGVGRFKVTVPKHGMAWYEVR